MRFRFTHTHRPDSVWEHRFDLYEVGPRGCTMEWRRLRNQITHDVRVWCGENLGHAGPRNSDALWYYSTSQEVLWIRSDAAAFAFKLMFG
jgi:hypothetical protein